MSLFTFFGQNKGKPEEVSDAELDAALKDVETPQDVSTKPYIKPQRLATIIETEEVEHFEQPSEDTSTTS
jgi:hypothetical protein